MLLKELMFLLKLILKLRGMDKLEGLRATGDVDSMLSNDLTLKPHYYCFSMECYHKTVPGLDRKFHFYSKIKRNKITYVVKPNI